MTGKKLFNDLLESIELSLRNLPLLLLLLLDANANESSVGTRREKSKAVVDYPRYENVHHKGSSKLNSTVGLNS